MKHLKIIALCVIAILLIVGIGVLIGHFASKKNYVPENESTPLPEVESTIDPFNNQDLIKCITEHIASSHFLAPQKSINVDDTHKLAETTDTQVQNAPSSCNLPPELCMMNVLKDLGNIMKILDIKLQLIEPSMLFCMLPSSRRNDLLTRGYDPNKTTGLKNVLTFGMLNSSIELFESGDSFMKIFMAGFGLEKRSIYIKFKQWNGTESRAFIEASHYFLRKKDLTISLVMFYPRQTFLWQAGLTATDMDLTHYLYLDTGAFEKSNFLPMQQELLPQIFIPSDSRRYLLEMESSKFVECKAALDTSSITDNTRNEKELDNNDAKNKKKLDKLAATSIKVLKTVFNSEMISFWLWSKSLLGWYENCDILHNSSKLEFAVSKKSIEGHNLKAMFAGSKCQPTETFGLGTETKLELNCEGMLLQIYFLHEENNTFWYQIDEGDDSYNVTYPVFARCSAAVSGQKVNVPCDVSKILETEYGQNWASASLDFNPKSMKNAHDIRKI